MFSLLFSASFFRTRSPVSSLLGLVKRQESPPAWPFHVSPTQGTGLLRNTTATLFSRGPSPSCLHTQGGVDRSGEQSEGVRRREGESGGVHE